MLHLLFTGTGNLPDLEVSFGLSRFASDTNLIRFSPTITFTGEVPARVVFKYSFSIFDPDSREVHRSEYFARIDNANVVHLINVRNNQIYVTPDPPLTDGKMYTFKVVVDFTHLIQESDEENNEAALGQTFGTADTTDLTVEIFPARDFATIGGLLYSGVYITHGRSTFTEPINSVPYTLSLFKGDVLIDSISGRHNIPAGVSGSGPGIHFALPDDLTPGTYSLLATVNSGGAITETNYNNNDDSHTITLR